MLILQLGDKRKAIDNVPEAFFDRMFPVAKRCRKDVPPPFRAGSFTQFFRELLVLTRREICVRFLQCSIAGGFFHIAWKYVQKTDASSLEVSFAKRPKEGEVLFRSDVYLVGLKQGVKAFSARCPHLGCRLIYNTTKQRFQCPCHGSIFSLEGRRLKGATKKDMAVLDLRSGDTCGTYCVTLPIF